MSSTSPTRKLSNCSVSASLRSQPRESRVTRRTPTLAQPDVEWLSYSAGLKTEDTDTSDSDRASVGVRRVTRLS
ncbi:MAG: hypothetical protein AAFX58_15580, partial [Pseudomonadota bacterium]